MPEAPVEDLTVTVTASITAGTVDYDFIALLPADEALGIWQVSGGKSARRKVFDGINGTLFTIETTGDPLLATANVDTDIDDVVGSFIDLVPNQTNRVVWVLGGTGFSTVCN